MAGRRENVGRKDRHATAAAESETGTFMRFWWSYRTPEGFDDLCMSSDGEALTGLWFVGTKSGVREGAGERRWVPVFADACRWLDGYFAGRPPEWVPEFRLVGATAFRREVSEEMRRIPFGATTTYGEIAAMIARRRGVVRMSAQAVGGAAGWNPIGIIIPCHRVVGAGGALTGYGGGMHNKRALLEWERRVVGARDGGGPPSPRREEGKGGTVAAQQNIDGGRGIECGEFLVKAKATEGGWWNGRGGRWVGEGFQ